jgi:hypothetical protein
MPSVSSNQFFLRRRKQTCYKQTSKISRCTVGGALRWCWWVSFCKPSSLSDTTLPANHHIPCLSITFGCLGILFLTLQVREILHTCYKQPPGSYVAQLGVDWDDAGASHSVNLQGRLIPLIPSEACFCFLYTPLPFPHYSASDLRLPFLCVFCWFAQFPSLDPVISRGFSSSEKLEGTTSSNTGSSLRQ